MCRPRWAVGAGSKLAEAGNTREVEGGSRRAVEVDRPREDTQRVGDSRTLLLARSHSPEGGKRTEGSRMGVVQQEVERGRESEGEGDFRQQEQRSLAQ